MVGREILAQGGDGDSQDPLSSWRGSNSNLVTFKQVPLEKARRRFWQLQAVSLLSHWRRPLRSLGLVPVPEDIFHTRAPTLNCQYGGRSPAEVRNRHLPPRTGLGLARAPVLTFFDVWVVSRSRTARWRVSSPREVRSCLLPSIVAVFVIDPEPKPPAANPLPATRERPTYGTGWAVNRETREGETRWYDRLLMP